MAADSRWVKLDRFQRVAVAHELRERNGWSWAEVAAYMGTSRKALQETIYDPDGAKKKARIARYGKPCPYCGKPMDGSGGLNPSKAPRMCLGCMNKGQKQEGMLRRGRGPVKLGILALIERKGTATFTEIVEEVLQLSRGDPFNVTNVALNKMMAYGLIARPARGRYVLTEQGRYVLKDEEESSADGE